MDQTSISTTLNHQNIEPGIYVFCNQNLSSQETCTRYNPPILPTTKDQLIDIMMSIEALLKQCYASPKVFFIDNNHKIEAREIRLLNITETENILLSFSKAYMFRDVDFDNSEIKTARFICGISIQDPDTTLRVNLSVYKDNESKGLFAIDDSFLVTLSNEDPVSSPFNGRDIYLHH